FFSSRRRHTRWPRDWSSDVCSSDLLLRPRPKWPRDRYAAEQCDERASFIKKLVGHEAVATGLSSTEKPRSAKRLRRRRACVSGRSEERRVGKEWRGGWGLSHEWEIE